MKTLWTITKFILKWGAIGFGIYFGFWLLLVLFIGFAMFSGLMSGIETASGPSAGGNSGHSGYGGNYWDRY